MIGQVGPKSGKQESLDLLLGPKELPGEGWSMEKVLTYRGVPARIPDEITRRARKSGCVAALGFYKSDLSSKKVIVTVAPLASVVDAELWKATFEERMGDARKSSRGSNESQFVRDLKMANGDQVTGMEQELSGGNFEGRNNKDIACNVDNYGIQVACSGLDGGWNWQEVLAVISFQSAKIKDSQDAANHRPRDTGSPS